MRTLVVLASFAAAAGSLGWIARAEEPAKPAAQPEPKLPLPSGTQTGKAAVKGGASAGSSSQDKEDERRATESKEKAKKRPGYKDEAPSPRG